jgi:hypothetical protein
MPYYDRSDLVQADHRYGGGKPASRHDPGADRADFLPGQRPRRGHHGAHHSAGAACSLSLFFMPAIFPPTCSPSGPSTSASSLTARGDGGEHLPRAGRRGTGQEVQPPRGDHRRGLATWTGPFSIPWPSSSPAIFPFTCCTALPACCSTPWPIPCLSPDWRADSHLDAGSRAGFLLVQKGRPEKRNRAYEWIKNEYGCGTELVPGTTPN